MRAGGSDAAALGGSEQEDEVFSVLGEGEGEGVAPFAYS